MTILVTLTSIDSGRPLQIYYGDCLQPKRDYNVRVPDVHEKQLTEEARTNVFGWPSQTLLIREREHVDALNFCE